MRFYTRILELVNAIKMCEFALKDLERKELGLIALRDEVNKEIRKVRKDIKAKGGK